MEILHMKKELNLFYGASIEDTITKVYFLGKMARAADVYCPPIKYSSVLYKTLDRQVVFLLIIWQ